MPFYQSITDAQASLLQGAKMFFVATVDPTLEFHGEGEGPLNLSPKGGVPLHVVDDSTVVWLDFRGSGNETLRHSQAGSPATLMACSFAPDNAAIIRLYGCIEVHDFENSPHQKLVKVTSTEHNILKNRQVMEFKVERTQTSCGYGVPIMTYEGERPDRQSDQRRFKQD